jgi:hypothetical protein
MPRRKRESQGIKTRDPNAAMRAKTALDLFLAGHRWKAVADGAGYASEGAAYNAVQRELQRTLQPVADEVRIAETLRLDTLLTVYWPKALSGDGWSFDRVLRLMERRASLLGLDAVRESQQPMPTIIEVAGSVAQAIRGDLIREQAAIAAAGTQATEMETATEGAQRDDDDSDRSE